METNGLINLLFKEIDKAWLIYKEAVVLRRWGVETNVWFILSSEQS